MTTVLRLWRHLYGENPLHLLSVLGCFALSGYVVSRLWEDPSLVPLAVWFAGAVIGHDLVLYPLYALADQPLVATRWARRRVRGDRPPLVPGINHVRLPALGAALLGLIWLPSITGRAAESFAFTAGHPAVGQFENWLLITGVLFLGSAVVYALRLGTAAGRGLVARLRSPGADPPDVDGVADPGGTRSES